jgi:hypothetical protein
VDHRHPSPLVRSRPLRVVVALALVAGACGSVLFALDLLFIVFAPVWVIAALVLFCAAPVAAWVIVRGRWGSADAASAQGVTVLLVGSLLVVGGAIAFHRGYVAVDTRRDLGTPSAEGMHWYAVAAVGFAGGAALLAVVPLRLTRRTVLIAIAPLGAAAALAAGLATASADDDECTSFEVDPARWRASEDERGALGDVSDRERMAEAIARCEPLRGATRREVERVLGPSPGRKAWSYFGGTINDGLGPGDEQRLYVWFGRDGRVSRTSLTGAGVAD